MIGDSVPDRMLRRAKGEEYFPHLSCLVLPAVGYALFLSPMIMETHNHPQLTVFLAVLGLALTVWVMWVSLKDDIRQYEAIQLRRKWDAENARNHEARQKWIEENDQTKS